MVTILPSARQLGRERSLCDLFRSLQVRGQCRGVSVGTLRYRTPPAPLPPPKQFRCKETEELYPQKAPVSRKIKVYAPPLNALKKKSPICREPLKTWNDAHLAILDPSSTRTRLFSPDNEDGARVGDVMLVRFRSGEPFAGVLMNIRRRGIDTGILLRNQIARVGTELWVKIYSPNVTGMEIVQRTVKRARRARLYYMRKPKHDRGSLKGLLEQYLKNKAATGRGVGKANRARTVPPKKAISAAKK